MMNTTHDTRTSDTRTNHPLIPRDGDRYWQAVLAHDPSFDGSFFYAVRSTGIYCRPSCPSRRPRRDQVTFYSRAEAAEQAGFRPCRRCGKEARDGDRATTLMVTHALGAIAASEERAPTLARLGSELHVPPHRLARGFKKITGITPREYAQARQIARFKTALRSGGNVTAAVYEAGYGSSRAAYERAPASLGMTPGDYHRGGAGKRIGYTIVDSPLGRLLIAATDRGLCSVCLGDSDAVLEATLFREYPKADIRQDNTGLCAWVEAFREHLSGRMPKLDLPVDIKATIFQQSVWREITRIPYGETRSYSAVAQAIGRPRAVRAVARACATNPVAVAIPCHRVVGQDGNLAGYRWGLERKRTLLEKEKEGGLPRLAKPSRNLQPRPKG